MHSSQQKSSLFANLMLIAGSLVVTVLMLVVLEAGLRLAGIGAADEAVASRLKYQQIYLPVIQPSQRPDGTDILRTTDSRLPYQSILAEKPADGLRIFTFGGSATAGLGFSPNVTFARHLERMLETAYPERTVEVVNLGIVALAARQVRVLVEDACRNFEPDAVLVYSGNNEFLEMHAEKYAAANAGMLARLGDHLLKTNLYRLLDRILRGPPDTPSLGNQNMSIADLQMTEDELIRDIEVTPEEIEAVNDRYEKTIDGMVSACRELQVPVVLMTVASNWEWRGREDLPADWLDEIVAGRDIPDTGRLRRARDVLSEQIETSPARERYELLFRRAMVSAELGDIQSARDDFRASMNNDPHLRRALDSFADRVRKVATQRDVTLVDVVEHLSSQARHGITGFDEFYDYVHFTPRGVVLVAAEVFRAMVDAGIRPEPDGFDPDDYQQARLDWQAGLPRDPLDAGDWMGFGFERSGIADRDLWKYDKFIQSLDERIDASPDDVHALVYRGNAHAFRVDGAAQAARDYQAALAIAAGDTVIRSNLERLLFERQP